MWELDKFLLQKMFPFSGGEIQRIKIVRNLGTSLNNITYIFDEPIVRLHPFDAERIINLLIDLRNNHKNILGVEHSRQIIKLADYIFELGPLAGVNGGNIVFEGTLQDLEKSDTLKSKVINKKIKINEKPLPWKESFEIKNAKCHNLKNINISIPKGVLTPVTGVAGSGKSSLIYFEFIKKYPDSIIINQKPIGTSIRPTPATYTGIMDEIRKIFSNENKIDIGWFSFNSKSGFKACKGTEQISYDMAFAETVVIQCEECKGDIYNQKALNYKYKNKNIEEIMQLTIEKVLKFF